jgi:hypothetical protein
VGKKDGKNDDENGDENGENVGNVDLGHQDPFEASFLILPSLDKIPSLDKFPSMGIGTLEAYDNAFPYNFYLYVYDGLVDYFQC